MEALEKECGVTQISLRNAERLIATYGTPMTVKLTAEREHIVEATWDHNFKLPHGTSHVFSGFAWGYGGEGPNGLAKFFAMLGLPIEIREIASWKQDDFTPVTFVKGGEYK